MQEQEYIEVPLLLEQDIWSPPSQKDITDSMEANNGDFIMETCLQREGMKNHMGRIYPKSVLERQFNEYQQFVDERSALGCTDHPQDSVVSVEKASFLITKQWWKFNERLGKHEWWGDLQILSGVPGQHLRSLVTDRVKFGISSRGIGSIENDARIGADIVQSDFIIICWDIVHHPSTHFAIPMIKIPKILGMHEANLNVYNRYTNSKQQLLIERSNKIRNGGLII